MSPPLVDINGALCYNTILIEHRKEGFFIMQPKQKRVFTFSYSWVIVALSFLTVCIALGFCSSAKSLFIAPITEALSISRSAFSINDSCRYIASAVINLFFGVLVARFGPKKLMCAGLMSLIVSMLLYSVAGTVWVFYIGGVFLGIGFSWTTTTMVGYVVNIWCRENRGTVMGAILAANGIGAAVAMQILSPIIYEEGNPFGYRSAYRLVALILCILCVLVLFFFKDKPKEMTESVPAPGKKKSRGRSWEGVEYSEALKKAYFYSALLCVFLMGVVLQGIVGVGAPLMKDMGIHPDDVANILSWHAIALTAFKFLSGVLYDKFGLRFTSNICLITGVIVVFLLTLVNATPAGIACAWIYSIFSSLALPLETIMVPIFASDLFGQKAYNKILGLFTSVSTAGFAVGTPIANLCYDITGTYNLALYVGCGIMVAVTVVMQFVISAADRKRRAVEEQK